MWVFCLHVCLCATHVPSAGKSQKSVLDYMEAESQMVVSHCGCWELSPGPLEK